MALPGYIPPLRARGTLVGLDGGPKITFMFNPTHLNRQDPMLLAENQAPGAPDAHRQYVGGGSRTIEFELILEHNRGDVAESMNALEEFTQPVGGKLFRSGPRAALTMGKRTWEGYVRNLSTREVRYDRDLNPIEARVGVSFQRDMAF